ncbi:MAG TPA: molybdopterin-dependent oxidoreductase [Bryobacteraceae bacterium]|nr:molybdopterin-dependent oxidoreductase [Bryobacteraceae bacterium]
MSNRHPEIALPEPDLKRQLRRRTRRDFLISGLAAVGAISGYEWLQHSEEDNGEPVAERRVLEFNRKLAHRYVSDAHLMPTYSKDQIQYLKPNGNVGVDSPLDLNAWKVQVKTDTGRETLDLSLADIKALPRVEMITRFCCIEGWSVVTQWAGARFSDFTKKYFPPGQALPQYVYMATPDEDYYVGLDTKSAMHPQTLLAYEHNGKSLEVEHGAPLRLAIPVKYGIKNIKRIGIIQYTDKRPSDYWYEDGYDWFAGL